MKLVEVIRGIATSDRLLRRGKGTAESWRDPVEVVHDAPGFAARSRAHDQRGDLRRDGRRRHHGGHQDEVLPKLGSAHPMGPLTLADFIGLDICLDILRVLHSGLGEDKYRHPARCWSAWWTPARWPRERTRLLQVVSLPQTNRPSAHCGWGFPLAARALPDVVTQDAPCAAVLSDFQRDGLQCRILILKRSFKVLDDNVLAVRIRAAWWLSG